MAWLACEEIALLGLASVGEDVRIDEGAVFFDPQHIHIGSHSQVDMQVLLSAGEQGLFIGSHVHLSAGTRVYARRARVTLEDFVGLSAGASLFSVTDDYSGGSLSNPTTPADLRNDRAAPVTLGKHVLVGAGSVILPGVSLGTGASVGALTLVHRSVPSGAIVAGNPMRRIGTRDVSRLDALEKEVRRRERNARH